MAKTSGEIEKEFLDSAKEKTGKSINDWLSLIKKIRYRKTKRYTGMAEKRPRNQPYARTAYYRYLSEQRQTCVY